MTSVAFAADTTIRASVASNGAQGNGGSLDPSRSASGKSLVFHSGADNLVRVDRNRTDDVFLHGVRTERTKVSVASDRRKGNRFSGFARLAADGQFVAFYSRATNLVTGDTNGHSDVFVLERSTGAITRVSVATGGAQANIGTGATIAISGDGRFVAFDSGASNLVRGDSNDTFDVFVRDWVARTTERVSVATGGAQAGGPGESSSSPAISADGRLVAFFSYAEDLVPNDTNGKSDVFVHDRTANTTFRVSVASNGAQSNGFSDSAAISANGRYVAFTSTASNLVADDTNDAADVFVHDLVTGKTERVSVVTGGAQASGVSQVPALAADGRFVAFQSEAADLVPGDTNGAIDVFRRDRQTGATTRVSLTATGGQADGASQFPAISADGTTVAFLSDATNLVPGDTNGWTDVFVRGP